MKIAYFGYDALCDCLFALERAGCEIAEIFTCPTDNRFEFNHKIMEYARRKQIPCCAAPVRSEDLLRLSRIGCRAAFCAGYFYKIPVSEGSLPIANVHPSLLPEGRGAWPVPVQILRQMDRGGVTLHKVAASWDCGDILLQKSFSIAPDDNLETVMQKVNEIAAALCPHAAHHFDAVWGQAVPQEKGSYWACPQKDDYTITPLTPPEEIDCILRAFYGFDCYLKDGECEQEIVRGQFVPQSHQMPFGSTFSLEDGGLGYWVQGGRIETPPNAGEVL